jgi:hypothetical protein
MKRCPQCEFIYEDDQNLCDMDGAELSVDHRLLPNLQALQEVSTIAPTRRSWKGHTVPAFASLILMVALLLVYYVSVRRAQPYEPSTTTVTQPPSAPASTVSTRAIEGTSASLDQAGENSGSNSASGSRADTNAESGEVAPATAPDSVKKNKERPVVAPRNSQVSQKRVRVAPREEKKDSKVESFFKKTGDLFKKPFKH